MKVILIGINSKYIHTNLAIRYLKVNCDYPVTLKEFTIKDSISKIMDGIMEEEPDIIGFSVYIWNIEIIKELLNIIKTKYKNKTVILGGPEVSYEYNEFLDLKLAKYIIFNEGEIAFNKLIDALVNNKDISGIPNLSYYKDNNIIRNRAQEIQDLNSLKNPYKLDNEDIKNKIQYIELSRGCPYSCSYCMASLEKTVRFFDINRVKQDIQFLYKNGAKTFKFLDRTFNLKAEMALDIYKFVIENDFKNAVFQFEINGDILKESVLDYLVEKAPKNRIRFEIGIQSTNNSVNLAVDRQQDNGKLFKNIHKLNTSMVDMHLDLIAGLPYEDYDSFKNTFNTAFKLYAKELQLGFLKLLKGTKLYYQAREFGYRVHEVAPYELIDNQFITKEELYKIHIVEEALEIYWNKGFLNRTTALITKDLASPFDFFLELGNHFIQNDLSFHRYQLFDIFQTLEDFLGDSYKYDIRYDYLDYNNIKPKIYWDNPVKKNDVIRLFHKENPHYNIDVLYKYSVVIEYMFDYLIVLYLPNKKEMHIFKKN
ncbi:MAG: DUF4080 domain-containing protein [Tenericutes bacterium]|nr:DUF4080 domain-containing protein [Mycoplasmatota bacterium]